MTYEIKGNYFHGQFHLAPLSGTKAVEDKIEKHSPADLNDHLWTLPIENRDIDRVIESANAGFQTWRKTSVQNRSNFLKKYQEQVVSRKEEIAKAISLETGKPFWEALTEVGAVIAKVDVTINDSYPRIATKTYENIMPGVTGGVHYKPLGPCLIIGPFNFPCHLANGQILSALLAGNSIIFKPSEKTAYSGQLLIECFHQAGFPQGVVNLIQGRGDLASRIIKEKSINGIFFTGSKEVGTKILQSTSSDLGKLVALELGGKNTCIIHKDADIDHALLEILKASFWTTGQRCVSCSKVAIHESIEQEFLARFHQLAKKIIIDHPIKHDEEPFMGPLVDEQSMDNYLVFMGMAIREGAEEVMRGKQLEKKFPGYYVTPSIHRFEKFNEKSHFLLAELFGPNVSFVPYKEIEEAIHISNYSEYGLATGIFTNDKSIQEKCIDEIESGILNINRSTCGSSSKLPFGGIKNSGNYRPAALATIDSCVYPLSTMHVQEISEVDWDKQIGLKK